jgi:hypothetical protein
MADLIRKRRGDPDETLRYTHGPALLVRLGNEEVGAPSWSPAGTGTRTLKPHAEGATSCPLTHREYVVSGPIRYRLDGPKLEASPAHAVFIPPGHRAWVLGDETCVLIDW